MTTSREGGLQIPNKLYFRIGEVSEITGVQPYTLRHWEMEFPTLSPKKNDAGQRLYRKEDIEMVHTIQRLLHSEGYTTAGARRLLSKKPGSRPVVPKSPPPPPPPKPDPPRLSPAALEAVTAALGLMDRNDERLTRLEAPED